MTKVRHGFFGASGEKSGSGIRNVIETWKRGLMPSVCPRLIISCNGTGGVSKIASEFGINFYHFKKPYDDPLPWQSLFDAVDYLWLIGCSIRAVGLEEFIGRIANEHPADLTIEDPEKPGHPLFGGKGMTDIHVHRKVLERGLLSVASTTHFVRCQTGTDRDYDSGNLIINVNRGDCGCDGVETADGLQDKVKALQKQTTPLDIEAVASGRIRCERNVSGLWHVVRD